MRDVPGFIILFGKENWDASRDSMYKHVRGDNMDLVKWQETIGRKWIGAEVVKSLFGYSLRYESGLDNFDLIVNIPHGGFDDSYGAVLNYAEAWFNLAPESRYVFTRA